jgi:type I restriction enzyme S subunit
MFKVFKPSLAEQQHIMAYLDSVQAKADTLRRLQTDSAAELDALLPTVLNTAFRGEL